MGTSFSGRFPDCQGRFDFAGFRHLLKGIAALVYRPDTEPLLYPVRVRLQAYDMRVLWILSSEQPEKWDTLTADIKRLFAAQLFKPVLSEPGSILTMEYQENGGKRLDLSSAGRGFQQMLLILGFLYSGQNSILLLDEPYAHLEVLRQKEIFQFLSKSATDTGSQFILATHSETVLDEAAQTGQIIAFIGQPHD